MFLEEKNLLKLIFQKHTISEGLNAPQIGSYQRISLYLLNWNSTTIGNFWCHPYTTSLAETSRHLCEGEEKKIKGYILLSDCGMAIAKAFPMLQQLLLHILSLALVTRLVACSVILLMLCWSRAKLIWFPICFEQDTDLRFLWQYSREDCMPLSTVENINAINANCP